MPSSESRAASSRATRGRNSPDSFALNVPDDAAFARPVEERRNLRPQRGNGGHQPVGDRIDGAEKESERGAAVITCVDAEREGQLQRGDDGNRDAPGEAEMKDRRSATDDESDRRCCQREREGDDPGELGHRFERKRPQAPVAPAHHRA